MNFKSLAIATLAGLGAASAAHASVTGFRLYHDHALFQDAGGLDPFGASLNGIVITSIPNEFTSGTFTTPSGATQPLKQITPTRYSALSFGGFNTTYPTGTYGFALANSASGETAAGSIVYATDGYANMFPTIANYAALRHYDPTKPFNLVLASGFTVPSTDDRVGTAIAIFDAKGVLYNMFFPTSTQTVFTIPAGIVPAEDHLQIEINFYGYIDGPLTAAGASTANIFLNSTYANFNSVPEPAAIALGLAGLGLTALARARRR